MATAVRIELVAKRQDDLQQGKRDYLVYAGPQLVGRIYQLNFTSTNDDWFWGVNGLTVDMTIGAVMHGYATGFDDAKAKLRAAFETWLAWARAMPPNDLKYPKLKAEITRMA